MDVRADQAGEVVSEHHAARLPASVDALGLAEPLATLVLADFALSSASATKTAVVIRAGHSRAATPRLDRLLAN